MNPPSPGAGAGRRFAGLCYTSRHWPAPELPLALPPDTAQALADLLPILLCGEESAEFVFAGASATAELTEALRQLLSSVAEDERRHGSELAKLRAHLPPPRDRRQARRAARFLLQLVSDRLGTHLARIAALDAGVCRVLAAVCMRGRPIARVPELAGVFNRIRSDEGRHVRIGRHCARALGIADAERDAEARSVLAGFVALLEPSAAAFAQLGVHPQRLFRRLENLVADSRRPATIEG